MKEHPMLQSLIPTVMGVLLVALPMSSGGADAKEPAADKETGYIKAEVRGTLRFQEGRGYFIAFKSEDAPQREHRVWLWISEQKALVRQLQGLTGKEVVAKGNLQQMPEDVHASVPPHGLYLQHFKIEAAEAKK
jgi:hypothetical protein